MCMIIICASFIVGLQAFLAQKLSCSDLVRAYVQVTAFSSSLTASCMSTSASGAVHV